MKYQILFSFSLLIFLLPILTHAETEEEEMARYQQQLNQQVFGVGKKKQSPEPAAPPPTVTTAPAKPATPAKTVIHYKLAGLSLGMEEEAVLSSLQTAGYTCNMAEMAKLSQVVGAKMCIYVSTETPKIAMIRFSNGTLRDLELREEYKSGFPDEIYKQIKDKFLADYSGNAKCRTQRHGETCEVFGNGYRIVLRSEIRDSKATITRSVKMM